MADPHGSLAQAHRLYVQLEARASSALESLVGTNMFGELLATSASNAMALARLANGSIDRGIRALRIAGRADVTDLGRQLARTEDKLERMLQLVEELEDRLAAAQPPADVAAQAPSLPDTAAARAASRSNGGRKARTRTPTPAAAPAPAPTPPSTGTATSAPKRRTS